MPLLGGRPAQPVQVGHRRPGGPLARRQVRDIVFFRHHPSDAAGEHPAIRPPSLSQMRGAHRRFQVQDLPAGGEGQVQDLRGTPPTRFITTSRSRRHGSLLLIEAVQGHRSRDALGHGGSVPLRLAPRGRLPPRQPPAGPSAGADRREEPGQGLPAQARIQDVPREGRARIPHARPLGVRDGHAAGEGLHRPLRHRAHRGEVRVRGRPMGVRFVEVRALRDVSVGEPGGQEPQRHHADHGQSPAGDEESWEFGQHGLVGGCPCSSGRRVVGEGPVRGFRREVGGIAQSRVLR